jgi:hypothetical protein
MSYFGLIHSGDIDKNDNFDLIGTKDNIERSCSICKV